MGGRRGQPDPQLAPQHRHRAAPLQDPAGPGQGLQAEDHALVVGQEGAGQPVEAAPGGQGPHPGRHRQVRRQGAQDRLVGEGRQGQEQQLHARDRLRRLSGDARRPSSAAASIWEANLHPLPRSEGPGQDLRLLGQGRVDRHRVLFPLTQEGHEGVGGVPCAADGDPHGSPLPQ